MFVLFVLSLALVGACGMACAFWSLNVDPWLRDFYQLARERHAVAHTRARELTGIRYALDKIRDRLDRSGEEVAREFAAQVAYYFARTPLDYPQAGTVVVQTSHQAGRKGAKP